MHTPPATSSSSHTPPALGRRSLLTGAAVALGGASLLKLGLPASAEPDAEITQTMTRQSPINIATGQVTDRSNAPALVVDYPTSTSLELEYVRKDTTQAGCSVRREDETVEAIEFSSPAFVRRDGERYRLVNTHFHIGSEHAVNGDKFAMEQHFVHERVSDGTLLVIGVLLTGGGNAEQDRLLAQLPRECNEPLHLNRINLNAMLPTALANYNYAGSLTTPPFAEGVIWHVIRQPQAISNATIRRFRDLFPNGNARPLQPRNGRPVNLVPGRRL